MASENPGMLRVHVLPDTVVAQLRELLGDSPAVNRFARSADSMVGAYFWRKTHERGLGTLAPRLKKYDLVVEAVESLEKDAAALSDLLSAVSQKSAKLANALMDVPFIDYQLMGQELWVETGERRLPEIESTTSFLFDLKIAAGRAAESLGPASRGRTIDGAGAFLLLGLRSAFHSCFGDQRGLSGGDETILCQAIEIVCTGTNIHLQHPCRKLRAVLKKLADAPTAEPFFPTE